MILILIFAALVLIGVVLAIIGDRAYGTFYYFSAVFGTLLIIFSGIILTACVVVISIDHLDCVEDKNIKLNQMQYESLLKEKELAESSTHDDIGRITVTKDIVEWNKEVYKQKRAVERKWINWFYSKRVVDELTYIDMSWE